MDNNNNLDFLDVLTMISFTIGYNNLIENKKQSAHNDINIVTDKQSQYLLKQINERFNLINYKLDKILGEGEMFE